MSITVNCVIDLTEEELLVILRRRAYRAIVDRTLDDATAAVSGNETSTSVSTPEPEPVPVEPPPLPPKSTRRAKTNGAEAPINSTPLAPSPPPEPAPLDEPAMRSLLSKVGAVHPLKVKAITDLLEAHGGHRRLSECDPATWPAIATAARVALKEHSA